MKKKMFKKYFIFNNFNLQLIQHNLLFIEYNNKIYIKNKLFYKESNITIEPNKTFNYMDKNSITLGARFFFHNGFRWFKNINKLSIYNKYLFRRNK